MCQFCVSLRISHCFRRIPLEDVPIETDEACGTWLRETFRQKVGFVVVVVYF